MLSLLTAAKSQSRERMSKIMNFGADENLEAILMMTLTAITTQIEIKYQQAVVGHLRLSSFI